MKNLFLLFTFLVISSITGLAQNYSSDSPVTRSGSVPSTCTAGDAPTVYGADIYICVAGTRYTVSTTAAGGSISGLTATRVPVAASGTTLTDYSTLTYASSILTTLTSDSATNSVSTPPIAISHKTSGVPATGLGTGLSFFLSETAGGTPVEAARIEAQWGNSAVDRGVISFKFRYSSPNAFVTTEKIQMYLAATTGLPAVLNFPEGNGRITGVTSLDLGSSGTLQYGGGTLVQVTRTGNSLALQGYPYVRFDDTLNTRTSVIGGLGLGINKTTAAAALDVVNVDSTAVGAVVKLAPSQSADALQVQNSSGTVYVKFDSRGTATFNGINSYVATIGSISGSENYPGIWFGSAAPSLSNYAFLADVAAGSTLLNNTTFLGLRISNTTQIRIESGKAIIPSGLLLNFSSTSDANSGVQDLGLARNAAGVLEINNGTAGAFRDLRARAAGFGIAPATGTYALGVTPSATTEIGVVVKGVASQSGDLTQWQNSSGTVLVSVGPAGVTTIAQSSGAYGLIVNNIIGKTGADFFVNGPAANNLILGGHGASELVLTGTGLAKLPTGSVVGFTSGADPVATSLDAAFSRISAGLIGVGTGAAGSTAGSMSMTNLTLAGVANAAAGSVSAPSINFTDTATGFYRTGTNAVGVTLNGVNGLRFDPNYGLLFRSDYYVAWASSTAYAAADVGILRSGVNTIKISDASSGFGDLTLRGITMSGNFFAGPSTIESFTTNASALGTLNYYTDSQTIYYDTAAATADVTINVDASASVDLNTRLATGQMVTVVLAITNTGTAYKCNTLQVHSVGQTIKWVGGSAPTGNINAVDWYTFTIMKTGDSTYYVTGSQTSYK